MGQGLIFLYRERLGGYYPCIEWIVLGEPLGPGGDTLGGMGVSRRVSSAALHRVIPLYSLSLPLLLPLYTFISIEYP